MVRARRASAAVILAVAGGACSAAYGQDSVSASGLTVGDALSAYAAGASGAQTVRYVVDFQPFRSSSGAIYQVGPVAKSAASIAAGRLNNLIATTTSSGGFTPVAPLAAGSFALWSQPGAGVNAARNSVPGSVAVGGVEAFGMALSFLEFGAGPNALFGDPDDDGNVITALVAFDDLLRTRAYVTRVVSAVNRPSASQSVSAQANSSLGVGAVDELGNVSIQADGFNTGGVNRVTLPTWLRVNSAARGVGINQIAGPGGGTTGSDAAATTRAFFSDSTFMSVPAIVPSGEIGRVATIGLDFNGALTFQGGVSETGAHQVAGAQARGPISVTRGAFLTPGGPAGVLTGASLSIAPSATKVRGLSAFGLTTTGVSTLAGAVVRLELPATPGGIVDAVDGFDPAAAFGELGNHEFGNFGSQVSFRGGSGPVGAVVLGDGRLVLGGTVDPAGTGAATPQGAENYIAVATFDGTTGQAQWDIAAHTGGGPGTGKAVFGSAFPGAAEDVIGRVAPVAVGSGPSISSPAFDAAGNVYFMANVAATTPEGSGVWLIRGNRQADGGYRLERLLGVGDVFRGRNAGLSYRVDFLSVADGDSVDSGAVWSSSVNQGLLPGLGLSPDAGSRFSLGAVTVRARIVYDVDSNGSFGDAIDQAYNTALLITPGYSPADVADAFGSPGADGVVDVSDLFTFLAAFAEGAGAFALQTADIADSFGSTALDGGGPDGVVDVADLFSYLSVFEAAD